MTSSHMKEKVEISSKGIKKVLNKYNFSKAISEYVWNGFDAGADNVSIICKFSGNLLQKVEVTDNGKGIVHDELLNKFKPFYDSHKEDEGDLHHSKLHGKNGYGRLTFFKIVNVSLLKSGFDKDSPYFINLLETGSKSLCLLMLLENFLIS